MAVTPGAAQEWWQRGVVYQVYPRSFMDADGDGTGDLPGVTERLDYLEWLGVDAVWLSPIFPSPMADFGYDVSHYTDIDPLFGNLDDFDALVERAHGLDLKVILDYVPNHTSDVHPWFVESRSSRDNPKRDWFIWRDREARRVAAEQLAGVLRRRRVGVGRGDKPVLLPRLSQRAARPELAQPRGARGHARRAAVLAGPRSGRLPGGRPAPAHKGRSTARQPAQPGRASRWPPYDESLPVYSTDRPEAHEAIRGMRSVLEEYGGNRVLIGELYLPIDRLVAYYGKDLSGVHLPFNFHLITAPWNAREIAALADEYEDALPPGGWPTWVLGNHDRSRIASRVGTAQARVAAMLLLTLRGTPTIYYGDELGLQDVPIPPGRIQDPTRRTSPASASAATPNGPRCSGSREPNAGFCPDGVEPWLPLADDH